MPKIEDVAHLAGCREEDLYVCLGCKICSSVCILNDIGIKADPRSFIVSLLLGRDEVCKDPLLKYCTGCYMCTFFCPWEIRVPELVRAAREKILGPHPFDRAFESSLKLLGRAYELYMIFKLLPHLCQGGYMRLLPKFFALFHLRSPKKIKDRRVVRGILTEGNG
ncbi:MAG: hypothetical protein DRG50_09500 [Deltaproteobacteria bacterium]|nr:MAG: hypothetical protein DRG50_09500 [Deltaproteobacteria bacterium]